MPDVSFSNSEAFERAWQTWMWLDRLDWQYLPAAGGLLDQPAELMHDVLKIERAARWAKKSFQKGK